MSIQIVGRPTVVGLVSTSVAERADRVAVRGDVTLTYGELLERATHLAHRLRAVGAEPGDLIGQCVERSAGMVVAALGIQLAGCAYVAIDPAYPDERVWWMLEDSGAAVVVTDETNAGRVDALGPAIVVTLTREARVAAVAAETEVLASEPPMSAPEATDLAYVVYTSGSTGHPKGVAVDHAALTNLVDWHCAEFALTSGDRCTQIASPGFDAAMWELWPTLAAGATLEIVPEELRRDPLGLRDWLIARSITVSFLPTAVAETVIGLPWSDGAALRYLLTGGDALSARPAPALGFAVINNYGLSETAVVATSGPVSPTGDGAPSIGRAISGVLTEVVDEHGQPVAPGVEGELVIGGVAVARGYLHRPELTRERFFEDARGRWYRTGDRVRERGDGQIEFAGRVDDQLSVRGFRVEPGEVVAALGAHPGVAAGAVVAQGSSSADRWLLAYVVPACDDRPQDGELRDFVAGRLPEYMVPAGFVWLEELPLTAHGKVDREALAAAAMPASPPAPALEPAAPPSVSGVAKTVAGVIAGLLGIDRLGTGENFFLRGGHSMLGAQLIVRLEDLYGVEISLRFLFDHPTPAEIADEVQRQTTAARDPGLVAG